VRSAASALVPQMARTLGAAAIGRRLPRGSLRPPLAQSAWDPSATRGSFQAGKIIGTNDFDRFDLHIWAFTRTRARCPSRLRINPYCRVAINCETRALCAMQQPVNLRRNFRCLTDGSSPLLQSQSKVLNGDQNRGISRQGVTRQPFFCSTKA
jgi:hypothetical protein